MAEVKTVRQTMLDALFDKLKNMQDPHTGIPLWNGVVRGGLEDVETTTMPVVGMEESDEEVMDVTWPQLHRRLSVIVAFVFQRKHGEDVYDKFNYYLGALQYWILQDRQLGGVSYDVQEVSNSPRIVDKSDNYPGGQLLIDLYYKVRNDNPYSKLQDP